MPHKFNSHNGRPPIIRQRTTVFFTTSRDHALEAFGVQALDYVMKPWKRSKFEETLDRALSSVGRESAKFVSVKTSAGLCRVDAGTVVYVTAAKAANCKNLPW